MPIFYPLLATAALLPVTADCMIGTASALAAINLIRGAQVGSSADRVIHAKAGAIPGLELDIRRIAGVVRGPIGRAA